MAMMIARNDLRHSLREAGSANKADLPEFFWWVRLSMGFLFEAQLAIAAWRQDPDVKKFVSSLPSRAQNTL